MSLLIVIIGAFAVVGLGVWVGNRLADLSGAATQALKSTLLGSPKNKAPFLHVVSLTPVSTVRRAIDCALEVKDTAGLINSMYKIGPPDAEEGYAFGNVMDALFTAELQVTGNEQATEVILTLSGCTKDSRGRLIHLVEMNKMISKVNKAIRGVDPNAEVIHGP